MMDTISAFISKCILILGHLRYVLFGLGDDVDSWLYSMSVLDDMVFPGHGERYMKLYFDDFREYVLEKIEHPVPFSMMVSARMDTLERFRRNDHLHKMSNMMMLMRHHDAAARTLYCVNAAYMMAVYDAWRESSKFPEPYMVQAYYDYYRVLCSGKALSSYREHADEITDADIMNAVFIGNASMVYGRASSIGINAGYEDITGKYFSRLDPNKPLHISDDDGIDYCATLCAYHESRENHADFVDVYNEVSTIIGTLSDTTTFHMPYHDDCMMYMPLHTWRETLHTRLNGSLLTMLLDMVSDDGIDITADDVSWVYGLDYESFPSSQRIFRQIDRISAMNEPSTGKFVHDCHNLYPLLHAIVHDHDGEALVVLNALCRLVHEAVIQCGEHRAIVMDMSDFRRVVPMIFDDGSMDFGAALLAMYSTSYIMTGDGDYRFDNGTFLSASVMHVLSLYVMDDHHHQ